MKKTASRGSGVLLHISSLPGDFGCGSFGREAFEFVDMLEKGGYGLNLTYEVRMAILGHTGDRIPETMEGQIVRRADQIAYVNHDIDDAIRAGVLTHDDIPKSLVKTLGLSHGQRINTLVCDAIETSREAGYITLSPKVDTALAELRAFMFDRVYRNPVVKGEETKAKDVVCTLFELFVKNPDKLPERYRNRIGTAEDETVERSVADFISGMTDRYAIETYEERFVPRVWRGLHE